MALKFIAADGLQSQEVVLQKQMLGSVEVACLTAANLEGVCYKLIRNVMALDLQNMIHNTSRLEYIIFTVHYVEVGI